MILKSIKIIIDFFKKGYAVLFSLIVSGVIDVCIIINHPFAELLDKIFFLNYSQLEIFKRVSWNVITLIPAFAIGALSDKHIRKNVLIVVQICGTVFSLIFIFSHNKVLQMVALAGLGLTFNPLSIIRAFFLDNFNKMSAISIIAFTYILKNLPWQFIGFFNSISLGTCLKVVAIILPINAFLTKKFHKDRYDNKENIEKLEVMHKEQQERYLQENRVSIWLSIFALALAETTFYFLWIVLEENKVLSNWLMLTSFVTFISMLIIMLYLRIPRLGLISDIYVVMGLATLTSLVISTFIGSATISMALIITMLFNCVGGGFYLPFATDALIEFSGRGRRAVGAAFSELADTFGLLAAAALSLIEWGHFILIFGTIAICYLLAALIQNLALKKVNLNSSRIH